MAQYTMDRVVSQQYLPQYREGQDPADYYADVERIAEGLQRTGATHVMVNHALCAIPRIMDPQNAYMRFMEYGYCMNQFVHTTFDKDIYYSKIMQLNRERLLSNAALARKYGLRCYIMCVEPTFMQESLFGRYPHWRGPRVDNPTCSHKPLFAPCVQLPDVQDYYRQEIQGMLRLVPEIDEIHIFTNDTGAGFCYSSHLYAGPSGPSHCKACSPGKHAQTFCKVLLEAGRELNPDFRVVMTSGLGPQEKADFIDGAPEGICSSVYGAFAWGGGLEAYWGTMAIGPNIFKNHDKRQHVHDWAYADMRARIEPLKKNGTPIYVSYNPNYYRDDDDPRPLETYRITCDLLEMGADNIIGGAPPGKFSVNAAVMRRAMEHGREEVDVVLTDIAHEWVGEALAAPLLRAWHACDLASAEQPMLARCGHALILQEHIQYFPIVPDDSQLSQLDLDYYMTAIIRDGEKMKSHAGGVWRTFHFSQEDMIRNIEHYDAITIPQYTLALSELDKCLVQVGTNEQARHCLVDQRRNVAMQLTNHLYVHSWMMAAVHKLSHLNVPDTFPTFQEIIDLQIELTGDRSPERVRLMKKHRTDAFVEVDLTAHEVTRHLGTAGWEGAHEGGTSKANRD